MHWHQEFRAVNPRMAELTTRTSAAVICGGEIPLVNQSVKKSVWGCYDLGFAGHIEECFEIEVSGIGVYGLIRRRRGGTGQRDTLGLDD